MNGFHGKTFSIFEFVLADIWPKTWVKLNIILQQIIFSIDSINVIKFNFGR